MSEVALNWEREGSYGLILMYVMYE